MNKPKRKPSSAKLEWLKEHRELEYLRAAYSTGKKFKNSRFPSKKKRQEAKERLKERDEKLKEIGK